MMTRFFVSGFSLGMVIAIESLVDDLSVGLGATSDLWFKASIPSLCKGAIRI